MYNKYKNWFDGIEDKALGTLKVAVAQLLAEFDNESNKTFDGEDLTKRGQMEKLLSMIEGREQSLQEGAKLDKGTSKSKKNRAMTSSKRDID